MCPSPTDLPPGLVSKYDGHGPRYTSYPTAPVWRDDFEEAAWQKALASANERSDDPLALYVHLPFCEKRCLFCACNVVITQREDVVEAYLDRLYQSIDRVAASLPKRREISGMHWGGGTPTHLSSEQIRELFGRLQQHFTFLPEAELSIEVHPPVTTQEQMKVLRELGFNRVSFGVQDIDPEVQRIINRDQTLEQTEAITSWARELGYGSINYDLIYGLPGQTMDTWNRTLDEVQRLRPDRLAIYSYAHVPWLHPHQERMPQDRLPDAELKLELLRTASRRLVGEAGYEEIGFDHFALPTDDLAVAVREHRLYRNFMGYTVKPAPDYIGFGLTAISEVGNAFAQNEHKLNRWNDAIDRGESGVAKGMFIDEDDQIRKIVIERLMCNQRFSYAEAEALCGKSFAEYFARQWEELDSFEADGLVERQEDALVVTSLGRHFLRNLCMLFDRHLADMQKEGRFSRTV